MVIEYELKLPSGKIINYWVTGEVLEGDRGQRRNGFQIEPDEPDLCVITQIEDKECNSIQLKYFPLDVIESMEDKLIEKYYERDISN